MPPKLPMKLHLYHHHETDDDLNRRLTCIEQALCVLKEQGETIMATQQEIKAKLIEVGEDLTTIKANAAEIDGDVQEVLDKLNAAGDHPTPEQMDELLALATELKSATGDLATQTRAAADKVPEPPVV